MILKSPEIEIDQDDPFKYDELGRKASAEALTEFVLSSDSSLVVSIDAPWGQGKTTFLRMWRQHLINENIPTIYFNAWESDFSDNAWVCLIGEISAAISELSGTQGKAKKYLERAKNIGVTLLKRAIPVAVKLATSGALDIDKVTDQAIAGLAESVAKEEIEKYEKSKSSLSAFRENLEKLAECFSSPEHPRPLVFIIDELDRCRPNFAIEVLEKAKHLFNVNNIVFVLGVDKKQLGSSVRAVYGEGLDVDGYLRRFMDFDFLLPCPEKESYIKSLFHRYSFDEHFKRSDFGGLSSDGSEVFRVFSGLFSSLSLTLREREHCCSILANCIRTTKPEENLVPTFLCSLIVLKIKNNDLYCDFIGKKISSHEMLSRFKVLPGMAGFFASDDGEYLEACIVCVGANRLDRKALIARYDEIFVSDKFAQDERNRANRISSMIDGIRGFGNEKFLSLVNKIELASRFVS